MQPLVVQQVAAPGWPWYVYAVGIGVVALLVAAAYASVTAAGARHRRSALIRRSCARADGRTILVLLPAYRSGAAAAATVHDLYERAACPLRVTVAVYQENAPGDADVWGEYARLAPRHTSAPPNGYADKLRVLNYEADASAGPLHAAAELFRRTHRGERTVLLIQPGVSLADGWDEYAGTSLGDRVVSHVPGPAPRVPFERMGDGTAQALLRSLRSSEPRPASTAHTTFPCYEKTRRVVGLRPRVFPEARVARIVAVSTLFTFCSARVFEAAVEVLDTLPALPQYASDYYLSAALHKTGARFYSPGRTLCFGDPTAAAAEYRPRDWGAASLPSFRVYAEFAGATPQRVSGRATLGLMPRLEHGLDKYGSAEELERHTRRFRDASRRQ